MSFQKVFLEHSNGDVLGKIIELLDFPDIINCLTLSKDIKITIEEQVLQRLKFKSLMISKRLRHQWLSSHYQLSKYSMKWDWNEIANDKYVLGIKNFQGDEKSVAFILDNENCVVFVVGDEIKSVDVPRRNCSLSR